MTSGAENTFYSPRALDGKAPKTERDTEDRDLLAGLWEWRQRGRVGMVTLPGRLEKDDEAVCFSLSASQEKRFVLALHYKRGDDAWSSQTIYQGGNLDSITAALWDTIDEQKATGFVARPEIAGPSLTRGEIAECVRTYNDI